jgi:DNA repair protein RecN (Recombination protein N)
MVPMLLELTITDFAIIERLRVRLGEEFNVFTGETGAGKSILIDAVSALIGARLGVDAVRAGAERALVEGVFTLEPPAAARPGARQLRAVAPPRPRPRRLMAMTGRRRACRRCWRRSASRPRTAC